MSDSILGTLAAAAAATALATVACGAPTSPTSAEAPDQWTVLVTAPCPEPNDVCEVAGRTTATAVELRVRTNGSIFDAARGGWLQAALDADQDPSTPFPGASDFEQCASPDPVTCDVDVPGSNPFVFTFPVASVAARMPADHRSIDVHLNRYAFVDQGPGHGHGPQLGRIPASGSLTLRIR